MSKFAQQHKSSCHSVPSHCAKGKIATRESAANAKKACSQVRYRKRGGSRSGGASLL